MSWIICILIVMIIMICLGSITISLFKIMNSTIINTERLKIRYERYYNILNKWIIINDNKLPEYFIKNKIKTIAIYGCGNLGEILFKKLEITNIEIKYFIDKNSNENFNVFKLEEIKNVTNVDAIVVTPIDYYEDIKKEILKMGYDGIVLPFDEVILNIYNEVEVDNGGK